MEGVAADRKELKELRENVLRTVNSLELCWGCERVCECEEWAVKQEVVVWLCRDCLATVASRLQEDSSHPVSLLSVFREGND